MSNARCTATVYGTGMFRHNCTKPVTAWADNKPYCTTHNPERVAAKRKVRNEAWDKEWALKNSKWKLEAAAPALLAALKEALVVLRYVTTGWPITPDRKHEAERVILQAEAAIRDAEPKETP